MSSPAPWFRLDGKVALVTGGYGGIGGAVSRGLAEMGARIAVAGGQTLYLDGGITATQ
jgi:NAD(P)-dependent dehydrogenase (short-subunit alcohol dehydrogenase family)